MFGTKEPTIDKKAKAVASEADAVENSKTKEKENGKMEEKENVTTKAKKAETNQTQEQTHSLLKHILVRTKPVTVTMPIYENDLRKLASMGKMICEHTGNESVSPADIIEAIFKFVNERNEDFFTNDDKFKFKAVNEMRIDLFNNKGSAQAVQ